MDINHIHRTANSNRSYCHQHYVISWCETVVGPRYDR